MRGLVALQTSVRRRWRALANENQRNKPRIPSRPYRARSGRHMRKNASQATPRVANMRSCALFRLDFGKFWCLRGQLRAKNSCEVHREREESPLSAATVSMATKSAFASLGKCERRKARRSSPKSRHCGRAQILSEKFGRQILQKSFHNIS